MLRVGSLQHEYTVAFSGDPALALPEDETEREHALTVARETGAWHLICHANTTPTLFRLRPLPHSAYEWLIGETVRRNLTMPETCTLAVRLALRGVTGLDGPGGAAFKVDTEKTEDDQILAKREVTDYLAALGDDIKLGARVIGELGGEVMRRAQEGISPKR
jgi:hypothetical protein